MTTRRLPRFAYNWLSALGALLAVVSGATLLVLLGLGLFVEEQHNPYFGIFVYMVLPPVFLVGLMLIPLGMARQWRRWKRSGETALPSWPLLDLNRPSHRNAAAVFIVGTLLFVTLSAVGSYGAYHYSESVEFCGTTCHVMEPEYTTYQRSPHARVACAACHVGPGADWFVKSKLSGTYQIYAVATRKYPRPIPTPIESLRPAQETCEQCHWPRMIFGAQQRQFQHFLYDDGNTSWPINMLIKIGGGDPQTGQTAGIHWHMNIGVEVEYVARDRERQKIPWIRVTDRRTGRVTVYQDKNEPLTEAELAAAPARRMDCMDCHNRPSHILQPPDQAVDVLLHTRVIDPTVPGIKAVAVAAMAEEYATAEEARRGIAGRMTDAYRRDLPEIYEARQPEIEQAITATQGAYAHNVFPHMGADWSDYPNNIGHFRSIGCMRCHDGNHVSAEGVPVTRSCTACHTILAQGSGERAQVATSPEGLGFEHPEDIGDVWTETGCYECHTGTRP
jgi:nitrate/TMAO reductase-like tetraheme cytochrome c subunit